MDCLGDWRFQLPFCFVFPGIPFSPQQGPLCVPLRGWWSAMGSRTREGWASTVAAFCFSPTAFLSARGPAEAFLAELLEELHSERTGEQSKVRGAHHRQTDRRGEVQEVASCSGLFWLTKQWRGHQKAMWDSDEAIVEPRPLNKEPDLTCPSI